VPRYVGERGRSDSVRPSSTAARILPDPSEQREKDGDLRDVQRVVEGTGVYGDAPGVRQELYDHGSFSSALRTFTAALTIETPAPRS
jgi:hypothetical protein